MDATSWRVAPAFLALALVFPPRLLAPAAILAGVLSIAYIFARDRAWLFSRNTLIVAGALAAAAFFCLISTTTVHNGSWLQLEFLKYAVYAAAFATGCAVIRNRPASVWYVVAICFLIAIFYIASAVVAGDKFRIIQAWPLYPPDQNNTASVLIAMLPAIVCVRSSWLRTALLVFVFAFCAFVESRLGVIVVTIALLFNFFHSWRSGVVAIVIVAAIWGLLTLPVSRPQDTITRQIQGVARSLSSDNGTVQPPAAPPAMQPNAPLVQIGSDSDSLRIQIYQRAWAISKDVFPHILGMGDAAVVALLNDPPITTRLTFQHAHNFLLQSYLAYGLLATLSMVLAFVAIAVFAIKRRDWLLLATLICVAIFGAIEALVSDIRVLTVVFMLIGGLYRQRAERA